VDYDKTEMPATYDRGRSHSPETLRLWLEVLSVHVSKASVSDIVDLGCGTGRFSAALAEHFAANVVGVEPSEKMLKQARKKPCGGRVTFRRGRGEALPLGDGSADMVFMSMVFHHLEDPVCVARECRRVLRDGGAVCLRNSTVDQIPSFRYLSFFPGALSLAEDHLVSCNEIEAVFSAAGFKTDVHEIALQQIAPTWPACAKKMFHRADSILARLPFAAFQTGMAALRAHGEQAAPDEPVTENTDLFVFRRSGV
jgi:ubiquinone/menaquinone biosynthesis C-methylase UbiE